MGHELLLTHHHLSFTVNLDLGSFEPQIAALAKLAQMLVDGAPRFVFISSVARGLAWTGTGKIPEDRTLPLSAASGGYGRSKAVAEQILLNSDLPATVVRVGQLSGSSKTGRWDPSNWVPLILQSSQTLGCLPAAEGDVAWTPIDIAAQIVLDITFREKEAAARQPVMHLENPNRTPWNTILDEAIKVMPAPKSGKVVHRVSYAKWYDALSKYSSAARSEEEAAKEIPAIRLLSFFSSIKPDSEAVAAGSHDAFGTRMLATTASAKASEPLASCKTIDAGEVQGWIAYWKSVDFMKF